MFIGGLRSFEKLGKAKSHIVDAPTLFSVVEYSYIVEMYVTKPKARNLFDIYMSSWALFKTVRDTLIDSHYSRRSSTLNRNGLCCWLGICKYVQAGMLLRS